MLCHVIFVQGWNGLESGRYVSKVHERTKWQLMLVCLMRTLIWWGCPLNFFTFDVMMMNKLHVSKRVYLIRPSMFRKNKLNMDQFKLLHTVS